jgi:lipoprotein-anchoring transpeptidase ErfK/SrfK
MLGMIMKRFVLMVLGLAGIVSAGMAEITPASAAPSSVRTGLGYAAGTIVIVNGERRLYYMLGNGRAIRYPIAVGRASQIWTGTSRITKKRVNPDWLNPDDPTAEIVPGGPGNPLGERALNIGNTLYRIHGTPAKASIGSAVSNGCIRMFNADVKHLFRRVSVGTKVVAINSQGAAPRAGAPKPINTALYKREQAAKKRMAERKLRKLRRTSVAFVSF